jgi:hypothetical protein
MDTGFWTRLHGRLRHAALALGPDQIEELAGQARKARDAEPLPRRKARRGTGLDRTARAKGAKRGA